MTPRTQWTAHERQDRSQLAKIIHQQPLLAGSLVTMARVCGKAKCKCARGHKHVSLYLAIRDGKRRKMIYVPREMEPLVRAAVEAYQQAQRLTAQISQTCLERFQNAKKARHADRQAPRKAGRTRG